MLQQDAALTFSLGGLSKSAGLPQAKLGWMGIGGPTDEVQDALRRIAVIADAYLSVATPVQEAAGPLLERGAGLRHQIQNRLTANLETLTRAATAAPSCRVLRTDAG